VSLWWETEWAVRSVAKGPRGRVRNPDVEAIVKVADALSAFNAEATEGSSDNGAELIH